MIQKAMTVGLRHSHTYTEIEKNHLILFVFWRDSQRDLLMDSMWMRETPRSEGHQENWAWS